ncbi:MAG: YCF48-related protein [bacterium]
MKKLYLLIVVLTMVFSYKTLLCSDWTVQNSGTTNDLYGVYFVDAYNGCAVGEHEIILTTSDGGSNWQIRNQNYGTNNSLQSVHFINNNTGFAVGNNFRMAKTTDGGKNWEWDDISTQGQYGLLMDVFFINESIGWTVGKYNLNNNTHGLILKTTDGGNSWQLQQCSEDVILNKVRFVNINTGWIIGNSGVLLYTTDGGATWKRNNNVSGSDFLGLSAIQSGSPHNLLNSVELVGKDGRHYIGNEDGYTYSKFTSDDLYGIHSSGQVALGEGIDSWFVGGDILGKGVIWKRMIYKDGLNYSSKIEKEDGIDCSPLYAISKMYNYITYAVGRNGTILKYFPYHSSITMDKTSYCTTDDIEIKLTTSGNFLSGNKFIAYLSGPDGSFDQFTELGSINTDGSIVSYIPQNMSSGTNYKIQILSTNPISWSNEIQITLNQKPLTVITGNLSLCVNSQVKYQSNYTNYNLKWSVTEGTIIGADNIPEIEVLWDKVGEGTVELIQSNENCTNSAKHTVTINPLPIIPIITKQDSILFTDEGAASYQWYLQNATSLEYEKIPGATDYMFKPKVIGNYKVVITNSNGCLATSEYFYFTGWDNVPETNEYTHIIIKPIPANDFIQIEYSSNNNNKIDFRIINLFGETVLSKSVPNFIGTTNQQVDLSSVITGKYLLVISTGSNTIVKNILVIK